MDLYEGEATTIRYFEHGYRRGLFICIENEPNEMPKFLQIEQIGIDSVNKVIFL